MEEKAVPIKQSQAKSSFESYFLVTFILLFSQGWTCQKPRSFEPLFDSTMSGHIWSHGLDSGRGVC